MIDSFLKYFIISGLRKLSYKWRPRREAMTKARVSRGRYICNGCKGEFGNKEISVDHVIPVVGEEGFTTFDLYIERMFPPVEGWQVLCHECHNAKTKEEKDLRKKYRLTKKQKNDIE